MDRMEVRRKCIKGTATEEEYNYYKTNCMDKYEQQIGKPLFDMNDNEEKQYDILSYNDTVGDLFGYDCNICKNKGVVRSVVNNYITEARCVCWSVRNTLKRLEDSGLGGLLDIYNFDNYKTEKRWQKSIYEEAKRFIVDNNAKCFVMLGKTGCGKSHICTAISKELILNKGMDLKYMVWIDESLELKQYLMDGSQYSKRMEELKNTQVLYIDDLFKTKNDTPPSSADIRLAMEIINYRYNKARMDKSKRWITIVSTERTMDQLLEYDEAVAGRLNELAGEYMFSITGEDKNYRLKGE